MDLKTVELLEHEYLKMFYFNLSSNIKDIIKGLDSKLKILDDWKGRYGGVTGEISVFDRGAERVIYSFLNTYSQSSLVPNSAPVGSDLFFESDDAFIHIDLKTVTASLNKGEGNINDFKNIFIGNNQNSYSSKIISNRDIQRDYIAELPPVYKMQNGEEKICLTYFITLLFDKDTFETLTITIQCVPNGLLYPQYKNRVIQPGKNPGKARFRVTDTSGIKGVNKFELLPNSPSRVKVIYFDEEMDTYYQKKLEFYKNLYIN